MYTAKSLLLLKKFQKEQVINFKEIERISLSTLDNLKGELIYYEIPFIHCSDRKYKRVLKDEISFFQIQIDNLGVLRGDTSIVIKDLRNTVFRSEILEKYCEYYYNTGEVLLDLVLPSFMHKCRIIVYDLKSHLVGLRNNYYFHTNGPSYNNLSFLGCEEYNKVFYLLNNQQKLEYFSTLIANFSEQSRYCLE